MNSRIIILLSIIMCISAVNASTIVELTANCSSLTLGQAIEFHLEVNPEGQVGGTFSIQMEIEPNKFRLERTFLSYPSCPTCGGGHPLSGKITRDITFIPKYEGNYIAVANFGGVQKIVNFTVLPEVTITITTTTSTSSTSTSTSTSLTTSTTTTTETTSTIPERRGSNN
ncbi:MAG TPA: hypothetical protein EYP86_02755, partial [Candidatus Altiarchaeales archaeon]|nr:hypothetical protein [Candidatus Altiarchaeales archaeon]